VVRTLVRTVRTLPRRNGFYSPGFARYEPLREPKSVNLAPSAANLGVVSDQFKRLPHRTHIYHDAGARHDCQITVLHEGLSGVPRLTDPAPKISVELGTPARPTRRPGAEPALPVAYLLNIWILGPVAPLTGQY